MTARKTQYCYNYWSSKLIYCRDCQTFSVKIKYFRFSRYICSLFFSPPFPTSSSTSFSSSSLSPSPVLCPSPLLLLFLLFFLLLFFPFYEFIKTIIISWPIQKLSVGLSPDLWIQNNPNQDPRQHFFDRNEKADSKFHMEIEKP